VKTDGGLVLHVQIEGREVLSQTLETGPWTEVAFDGPEALAGEHTRVEVIADGAAFTSFHWWFAE
jgi:hypothetical protein